MRRNVLRAAVLVGLAVVAILAYRARGEPERAWSVQLHVHGSFSEGRGSIDSQSWQAADLGCDVVWWSDHDFRLTTYHHVRHFGFDDWEEPVQQGEQWDVLVPQLAGVKRLRFRSEPCATARFVDQPVREGSRSLRLEYASAHAEFETCWLDFQCARQVHQRTLASGVVLRLALWPEQVSADARPVIKVLLSEHAPRGAEDLVGASLTYVLSNEGEEPRRAGEGWIVPVPYVPGQWNELELRLSEDALAGYPESPALDNALYRLSFGLEARKGATVAACFDDLRFEQELSGRGLFGRQRKLIREVGALYPGLTELQGVEVSLTGQHLNLFCTDPPLPDYTSLARGLPHDPRAPDYVDEKAFQDAVVEWTVRETHARGGLVSYNHAFGAEGVMTASGERVTEEERQALLTRLLESRASGADILEVGYRDRGGASLADHLWLWDQLTISGLHLVGTGVNDSHGGVERWRGTPNNFVSWIWATEPDVPHLIEGLRAGRVFFGDLERFGGELDLLTEDGQRMGDTITTRAERVGVELIGRKLRGAEEVVVIESGTPTARFPVEGDSFHHHHELALAPKGISFVRFEVHDRSGPIALTNPIVFQRP